MILLKCTQWYVDCPVSTFSLPEYVRSLQITTDHVKTTADYVKKIDNLKLLQITLTHDPQITWRRCRSVTEDRTSVEMTARPIETTTDHREDSMPLEITADHSKLPLITWKRQQSTSKLLQNADRRLQITQEEAAHWKTLQITDRGPHITWRCAVFCQWSAVFHVICGSFSVICGDLRHSGRQTLNVECFLKTIKIGYLILAVS